MNSKVINSKTSAVVTSLAEVSRPSENGQGDRAASSGEKVKFDTTYAIGWFDLNSQDVEKERKNPIRHEA